MGKIYIDRSEIFNSRNAYKIYIGDKEVGTVENGENKLFEVGQGEHAVVAKIGYFNMGSPKVLVTVKGDEVKRLKVSGISGVIWMAALFAVAVGIIYEIGPLLGIEEYNYITLPALFVLYFFTFGRKQHLSLSLEG